VSATVRRSAVVVLLALSAACGGSMPTSPTGTSPSPTSLPGLTPPPPVIPPPSFPPLSGPSRTFKFDHADYDDVYVNTRESRFVLYDNGAFALQDPGGQMRGSFTTLEDGLLYFKFEINYGVWYATGKLEGDLLKVKYNDNMFYSDFEHAVYIRIP